MFEGSVKGSSPNPLTKMVDTTMPSCMPLPSVSPAMLGRFCRKILVPTNQSDFLWAIPRDHPPMLIGFAKGVVE